MVSSRRGGTHQPAGQAQGLRPGCGSPGAPGSSGGLRKLPRNPGTGGLMRSAPPARADLRRPGAEHPGRPRHAAHRHAAHQHGAHQWRHAHDRVPAAALQANPQGTVTGLQGTLSCGGLEALWRSAGGAPWAAVTAASIAMAESGGRQYAAGTARASVATGRSTRSTGLCQPTTPTATHGRRSSCPAMARTGTHGHLGQQGLRRTLLTWPLRVRRQQAPGRGGWSG